MGRGWVWGGMERVKGDVRGHEVGRSMGGVRWGTQFGSVTIGGCERACIVVVIAFGCPMLIPVVSVCFHFIVPVPL